MSHTEITDEMVIAAIKAMPREPVFNKIIIPTPRFFYDKLTEAEKNSPVFEYVLMEPIGT